MASASPLSPTFYGHIASTQDALLLFEACLSGALNHVARRPHDRERVELIKSGNVFIYEEHLSGIKRWTDSNPVSAAASTFDSSSTNSLSEETERSLIGSPVDSYGFKEEGLVKKTVSVTVGGVSHYLVSYYTVADVINNKFTTPSKDPRFQHITPRPDLVTKQNFRTPIDEVDSMDRMDERSVYGSYPYARNGYEMTNQSISHRPMSLLTPPIAYNPNSNVYSGYGVSPPSASYDSMGQPSSSSTNSSQFALSPGIYPALKKKNYELGDYRQQRYDSYRPQGHSNPHTLHQYNARLDTRGQ